MNCFTQEPSFMGAVAWASTRIPRASGSAAPWWIAERKRSTSRKSSAKIADEKPPATASLGEVDLMELSGGPEKPA